jgi:alkanesulfonate monooxygenase SsuD/methylene tetrahydromethanopterin reductase-like flavin-dependent oxidoreductase (luciferase family)
VSRKARTITTTDQAPRASSAAISAGVVLRDTDLRAHVGRLDAVTRAAARAGVDHLAVGDHVSFSNGGGADGLVQAAALLASHPVLPVQTAVYLLALRHPATVARQLATISEIAPGRLTFGVGVGGDDPRELRLCGIDPRTRGARTTEALELLKRFMTGQEVTFAGRFFAIDGNAIRPAPQPVIPILVGGRADAALVRAGRLGDGWIGVWVSARRYGEAQEIIQRAADAAGRAAPAWRHTLQLWAGFDVSRERAVARIRPVMEGAYAMPFERFERYTPCGRPEDVAAALEPYLEAGCRRFNFVAEADGLDAAIECVAAVKTLLTGAVTQAPATAAGA